MKKNSGVRKPTPSSSVRSSSGQPYGRRPNPVQRTGRRRKKRPVLNKVGISFLTIHLVVSLFFCAFTQRLGILPPLYFGVMVLLVLILGIGVLATQMARRKQVRIAGRVLSAILIALMCVVSYYVIKADQAINNLTTTSSKKYHSMVVVVNVDDPAVSISDASSYIFGVQYHLGAEQTEATVADIQESLGTSIGLAEYESLSEQVAALRSGEVGAIIYNEAFTPIIEEEYEGYRDTVRVIYGFAYEDGSLVSQTGNVPSDGPSPTPMPTPRPQTPELVTDECFSVFLSGIDTYGSIGTTSRSDSNIIAVVNPETRQILLVTTPRDYYVTFPGVTGTSKDKLTHAGIYGVEVSMATLSELYDLPVEYHVRVNFSSFIEIVDLLGGVDVYSEVSFRMGSKSVVKGYNYFTGKDALSYSRERYQLAAGDNQRGKNQQAVIAAMIQKLTSPSILANATRIMEKVGDSVDTNFTAEQIQTMVANQIADGTSWNIVSVAATGRGDMQYCYSYKGRTLYVTWPDMDSIAMIKEQIQIVLDGGTL